MSKAAYFRRQAESHLRLSNTCQDPLTAEHLRLLAAEYFQRATEIEYGFVEPPAALPRDEGTVRLAGTV